MKIKEESILNILGSHDGMMVAYATASKDGVIISVQEQSEKSVDLDIDYYEKKLTWDEFSKFENLPMAAYQVLRDSGVQLEGWS